MKMKGFRRKNFFVSMLEIRNKHLRRMIPRWLSLRGDEGPGRGSFRTCRRTLPENDSGLTMWLWRKMNIRRTGGIQRMVRVTMMQHAPPSPQNKKLLSRVLCLVVRNRKWLARQCDYAVTIHREQPKDMAAYHAGTLDPANCCKVACTPDEGRGSSFTKSMQKRNCINKKNFFI